MKLGPVRIEHELEVCRPDERYGHYAERGEHDDNGQAVDLVEHGALSFEELEEPAYVNEHRRRFGCEAKLK